MSPRRLFRLVARAEAVTWALLLLGMVLKYGTDAAPWGERAVSVFGMAHGVVFIAYCLTTVLLWLDQRWSWARLLVGLACAVPPFATLAFEVHTERAGLLGDSWRLRHHEPTGPLERAAALVLRRPALGAVAGVGAVAVLTGVALVAGPPA